MTSSRCPRCGGLLAPSIALDGELACVMCGRAGPAAPPKVLYPAPLDPPPTCMRLLLPSAPRACCCGCGLPAKGAGSYASTACRMRDWRRRRLARLEAKLEAGRP